MMEYLLAMFIGIITAELCVVRVVERSICG